MDRIRKIRKRSAVPLYGFAAVWLAYCLLFPLYLPWHFLLLIALSAAAYAALSSVFPGTVEYLREPEKPVSTGNEEVDRLLEEGARAVAEMRRVRDAIRDEQVRLKIERLAEVAEKIFGELAQDPKDLRRVKRFAGYYLPTTIKLIYAYRRMEEVGPAGENVAGTMEKIRSVLDTMEEGYRRQLDALFADQALDIETDIEVLEGVLRREGLAGKDF